MINSKSEIKSKDVKNVEKMAKKELHQQRLNQLYEKGQVALNDPAQNPHLGNALNDPTLGKRVHSMTPSLKKIFLRHKKIENQFKEI